nr:transposase [Candidatus Accumulibacter sp. ACC007]
MRSAVAVHHARRLNVSRCRSGCPLCRLEPFKRLCRTITNHLPGVLNGFQAGKHNGRVEAMNRALQEARARARGYRRVENFIAMAYLIAGKLSHLPVSPFARILPFPHETN